MCFPMLFLAGCIAVLDRLAFIARIHNIVSVTFLTACGTRHYIVGIISRWHHVNVMVLHHIHSSPFKQYTSLAGRSLVSTNRKSVMNVLHILAVYQTNKRLFIVWALFGFVWLWWKILFIPSDLFPRVFVRYERYKTCRLLTSTLCQQTCKACRHLSKPKHPEKSTMALTDDRIASLDALGFDWAVRKFWSEF